MLNIDTITGLDLKFKINLTGATFEQLNAWANIEPEDSDVSYQIPASIENGILTLKSSLDNIAISEKGQIKIKVQHGSNLHDVWNTEYKAVEKVQIVLEQIEKPRVEKKIDGTIVESKTTKPAAPKVTEKKEVEKKEEKAVEKIEEKKTEEKIFKFSDFKK